MSKFKRAFVIVLDSYGIGQEPDAAEFGDGACNTLKSIAASDKYDTPNMKKMGLFNIDGVDCGTPSEQPIGSFARLRELSRGKDTTTGHWEMAGIISERPMPTYPAGFPADLIAKLEQAFGRKILCNKPYSGTKVIMDYGREQEKTGGLIVYTSADSVFQIAANEADVPVEELYDYCRTAREILQGEHGVGRVIARPYVGRYPDYTRTSRRHDFSLDPTGDTMMDALQRKGIDTIGVGKISDIFAGRSISRSLAPAFMERMQRVAQDFAQQHLADQKLPDREREGYTLLLAMRSGPANSSLAVRACASARCMPSSAGWTSSSRRCFAAG